MIKSVRGLAFGLLLPLMLLMVASVSAQQYTPPNYQAQVLTPLPPGQGSTGANASAAPTQQAPTKNSLPKVQSRPVTQAQPKVFSRVPVRSRI